MRYNVPYMRLFGSKKGLRVLFVGTEAAPYAKVGGLSSVLYALPRALTALGHDARVMLPRYISVDEHFELSMVEEGLRVPTGNTDGPHELICNIKKRERDLRDPDSPVTAYFLENQEYFEQRANIYGYADDAVRWALLSRGVLEFFRHHRAWQPDIIVSADWQTGFIPNYLKTVYKNDRVLSQITSVFSIHNLFYQGMFDHRFVQEMDYDDGHSPIPGFDNPRLTKINGMRRGIMYADALTTVSPTYAKEIMTKEYGELLDDLLRERRAVLTGILNGIDYGVWNSSTDPYITYRYTADSLEERLKNKKVLQERFGLPADKSAFLVAIVSRLNKQKGFDLLYPIMGTLLEELPIQLVVVGEGDADFMGFFHDLETRYPKKVAAHLKFDSILPHFAMAGADAILMPSRFEPCGLTQVEAMRMGAVPIVRRTGGLTDTVKDYDPSTETGTGFVFEKFDSSSLMIAFIRAIENFRDARSWRGIQSRGMAKDFSWDQSARRYEEFFTRAKQFHGERKI